MNATIIQDTSDGYYKPVLTPIDDRNFRLDIDEPGSTGYVWSLSFGEGMSIVEEGHQFPDIDSIGGGSRRHFQFRCQNSGDIVLTLSRPWRNDGNNDPNAVTLTIHVT